MKKIIKITIFVIAVCLFVNFPEETIPIAAVLAPLALIGLIIWAIMRCLIIDPINDRKQKKLEIKELQQREMENKEKEVHLLKLFNVPVTKVYNYGYCKYIFVSESAKRIMINETVYDFNQILDCFLTDDSERVLSSTINREGSNTGNVIGRAVVGKILMGNAGAVVGGLTASKTATTSEQTIKDWHNYTLKIEIDSISTPVFHVPLGDNSELAYEMHALFKLILKRNQQI